jgi:hypothetical protein
MCREGSGKGLLTFSNSTLAKRQQNTRDWVGERPRPLGGVLAPLFDAPHAAGAAASRVFSRHLTSLLDFVIGFLAFGFAAARLARRPTLGHRLICLWSPKGNYAAYWQRGSAMTWLGLFGWQRVLTLCVSRLNAAQRRVISLLRITIE